MTNYAQLLQEAEQFIQDYFKRNVPEHFVFHDLEHTIQTVAATRTLAEGYQLSEKDSTIVQLATWFHDTGYAMGPDNHEERSCAHARKFLEGKMPPDELEAVLSCIRSTKVPQSPESLLEQIVCDADLSHLGMETYWERNSKLRQEFNTTRNILMDDLQWVEFEIEFMVSHEYHTEVARDQFNKRKAKHVKQLIKQKQRLSPDRTPTPEELAILNDGKDKNSLSQLLKESEKELKMARFGRGVETMYRTTYRTHTNLSQMADSKANLMLSVNAIIISIVVTNLLPNLQLEQYREFRWPTVLLILTCLGSMIYATLSTRPKVTEGKVTREAVRQRTANLLFFGNFHNMPLEEFQWGVNEMLKDSEFLYSSMSRDLYFLGIVLAKKYQYLSICYNIFMYGLIISVCAFGLVYVL